jgi:hypothetical protein
MLNDAKKTTLKKAFQRWVNHSRGKSRDWHEQNVQIPKILGMGPQNIEKCPKKIAKNTGKLPIDALLRAGHDSGNSP